MACLLKPDPKPNRDVIGTISDTPTTVFVKSDASAVATVVSATLNDAKLPVDKDGRVTLPKLKPGINQLNLVVVGVNRDDDVTLFEACDTGEKKLKTKFAGGAGGGAEPVMGFEIRA